MTGLPLLPPDAAAVIWNTSSLEKSLLGRTALTIPSENVPL